MAKGSSPPTIKNRKREKSAQNTPLQDNLLFAYFILLMLSEKWKAERTLISPTWTHRLTVGATTQTLWTIWLHYCTGAISVNILAKVILPFKMLTATFPFLLAFGRLSSFPYWLLSSQFSLFSTLQSHISYHSAKTGITSWFSQDSTACQLLPQCTSSIVRLIQCRQTTVSKRIVLQKK